jgi:rhodanese-related sulfurtransferase
MHRILASAALAAALALPAAASDIASSVDSDALPQGKRTALGLYLSPRDAHRALEADPGIVFVDVRSRAEFGLVGHPVSADRNIPFVFANTLKYDPEKGSYGWSPNPAFVEHVDALMAHEGKAKSDPVIVMCRSGGRSAKAADALAEAGYTQVYSLVEGFEGGTDEETGHRTKAGWVNADLPWTYEIRPEQRYGAGASSAS